MNIEFYTNSSSPETVTKSLTAVTTLSGSLKERTSMIDPSVIIQMDYAPAFNYCHIPAFGRYYFVKNITNLRDNIWLVDMHVDVLMSYRSQILQCRGICGRQEKVGNLYIPDPQRVTENDFFVVTKTIPGSYFLTDNYILTTQ